MIQYKALRNTNLYECTNDIIAFCISRRFIFILLVFCSVSVFNGFGASSPRVLNAIGITGGVTFSNQKWKMSDTSGTHTQRNLFIRGYNGSVFAELFSRDYTSFITELQFNQKGSTEKDTAGNKFKDKVNYICFNNFFRIRYDMDRIIPYILFGTRLEYALSQSTTSPAITGSFKKIHVTASVGAGIEFINYGNIKFFTEAHFNPDVMRSYKQGNLSIRTTAYEIRVGLKYIFSDKKWACPPVYDINNYKNGM